MATEARKKAVLANSVNDCEDDPSTPRTYVVKTKRSNPKTDKPELHTSTFGPEDNGKKTKCIFVGGDYQGEAPLESWLNFVLNFALGVEWGDDYRFKWFPPDVYFNAVQVFTLNYEEGQKIPYNLKIVYAPKYKSNWLGQIDEFITDPEEYYYYCNAKKIKEPKQLEMFCSDVFVVDQKWSLLLSGTAGSKGSEDHIEKNKGDKTKAFTGEKIFFPNPDIVFLDHKEDNGENDYNGCIKAFETMLLKE